MPNLNKPLMPPSQIIHEGEVSYDDVRRNVSKVNVKQQLGVSPSALVTHTTIASAALEGQLSSGFHPSALAS